jgi:uncharacterized protein (TIGR04255 family)
VKVLKGFKKSPLVNCTIEVRFKHSAGEIVPGLVYGAVSKRYGSPKVEALPIMQLPQQIREQDQNLAFQPTNRINAKNFTLNVGPRVLGLNYDIARDKRYPGWDALFSELKSLNTELGQVGIFRNIERIGIRYINFFQEDDFLKKLSFSLSTPWTSKVTDELNFGFVIKDDAYRSRIVISTKATLKTALQAAETQKEGQILDIDTFLAKPVRYTDLLKTVDECHEVAKKAFMQSLNPDFLESLGPEYA